MALKKDITKLFYAKCTDGLDTHGYVLMWDTANPGQVKKHDGTVSYVVGVNLMSTKDPITEKVLTGQVVAIIRHGVVMLKLSDTNAAIEIGDKLKAVSGGVVDKYTEGDTTTAWPATYDAATAETITDEIIAVIREEKSVVGFALESKAAAAGGFIKCLLQLGSR